MIVIKNVHTVDGICEDIDVEGCADQVIDGTGLTLMPALIDPHVHYRVPGAEHKEDWITGAQAAIAGGVTTVFDMPNTTPACTTAATIKQKLELIQTQLKQAHIPLRYYLYIGADRHHLDQIPNVKHQVIGIKMFMGSSTGDLLIDDLPTQSEVFALAAKHDMLLAVHAEDEAIIKQNQQNFTNRQSASVHSAIRQRDAAIAAVDRAVTLAEKYHTRLCILHCSTKEELTILKQAKKRGVTVSVEACPRHLFLDESDYARLGMLGKINPPLRTAADRQALWEAIHDGTVDFIGSDHSPHALQEKQQPYDWAPAGAPGVELTLPLLLDACNRGWLSLKKVTELTCTSIEKVFNLTPNHDVVLVDRRLRRIVTDSDLKTKVGWSPFRGMTLTGWPKLTIIRGNIFEIGAPLCHHVS